MLAWSALLVQKIDLRVRGLTVEKLQVNRHRAAEVRRHAHPFHQAVLYLSGAGRQSVAARFHDVRTGDLFLIPRGCVHGFVTTGAMRPVSLVLDFVLAENTRRLRASHRRLEPAALNLLHRLVSELPRKGRLTLADYPKIASIVTMLFETSAGSSAHARESDVPSAFHRVRAMLLDTQTAALPLAAIARRTGYAPDYLTRKLRRESGQGLRGLRDSLRLEAATVALRRGSMVADAAQSAGFADPAYFARWFRRRLGLTPQDYRKREAAR